MGKPEEVLLCGSGDSQMEDLEINFVVCVLKSGYFESHVGQMLLGYVCR